jgi:hypothetical protein
MMRLSSMTCTGRGCAPRCEKQRGAPVLHDLLNTACVQPTAYRLLDDRQGRQIVWQHAPMHPRSPMHPRCDDSAHTAEDVTQVATALADGF